MTPGTILPGWTGNNAGVRRRSENGAGRCIVDSPPVQEHPVPESIERREIVFRGRVQGVGFRATTRAIAQSFQVTGWVRNELDGSVRMEAQGTTLELDLFVDAVRARMNANLSSVEARSLPTRDESAFEVRR